MKLSERGLTLIKNFEGFYSKPYLCPAKVPTIGYGTTYYPSGRKVKLSDSAITEPAALELLRQNLVSYESSVKKLVKSTINQNQYDALVSFAYNLGAAALSRSTLLKKVNIDPNDLAIRAEFAKWVYAAGKKLKGLERRREAESRLYFEN